MRTLSANDKVIINLQSSRSPIWTVLYYASIAVKESRVSSLTLLVLVLIGIIFTYNTHVSVYSVFRFHGKWCFCKPLAYEMVMWSHRQVSSGYEGCLFLPSTEVASFSRVLRLPLSSGF